MSEKKIRKLKVYPGIGDNIWTIMKLINSGEKFDWILSGDLPHRGKQVFDLFPQVTNSVEYDSSFTATDVQENNIIDKQGKAKWEDIDEDEFFLGSNGILESGKRIEEFLPDLPVTYRLDYKTKPKDKKIAKELLPDKKVRYIGCYGSSYSVNRHWNFWLEREWVDLISRMRKESDVEVIPVMIGADFDIDLASNTMKLLDQQGIPYVNTIGQPLSVVIEVMKKLWYGFYFPSGLGIISGTLGLESTMFYPKHLAPMQTKWVDPTLTAKGIFKECQFCTPIQITTWLKNEYKLFDK